MTMDDFRAWYEAAPEGNVIEYHRGFLAWQRDYNPQLSDLADAIYALAESGHLALTQIRHGAMDYSYLATRG